VRFDSAQGVSRKGQTHAAGEMNRAQVRETPCGAQVQKPMPHPSYCGCSPVARISTRRFGSKHAIRSLRFFALP